MKINRMHVEIAFIVLIIVAGITTLLVLNRANIVSKELDRYEQLREFQQFKMMKALHHRAERD